MNQLQPENNRVTSFIAGLDFKVRPTLRLREVEDAIGAVIKPVPSRHTLIKMVNTGDLDGRLTRVGYVVFVDSLEKWLKQFAQHIAA